MTIHGCIIHMRVLAKVVHTKIASATQNRTHTSMMASYMCTLDLDLMTIHACIIHVHVLAKVVHTKISSATQNRTHTSMMVSYMCMLYFCLMASDGSLPSSIWTGIRNCKMWAFCCVAPLRQWLQAYVNASAATGCNQQRLSGHIAFCLMGNNGSLPSSIWTGIKSCRMQAFCCAAPLRQ